MAVAVSRSFPEPENRRANALAEEALRLREAKQYIPALQKARAVLDLAKLPSDDASLSVPEPVEAYVHRVPAPFREAVSAALWVLSLNERARSNYVVAFALAERAVAVNPFNFEAVRTVGAFAKDSITDGLRRFFVKDCDRREELDRQVEVSINALERYGALVFQIKDGVPQSGTANLSKDELADCAYVLENIARGHFARGRALSRIAGGQARSKRHYEAASHPAFQLFQLYGYPGDLAAIRMQQLSDPHGLALLQREQQGSVARRLARCAELYGDILQALGRNPAQQLLAYQIGSAFDRSVDSLATRSAELERRADVVAGVSQLLQSVPAVGTKPLIKSATVTALPDLPPLSEVGWELAVGEVVQHLPQIERQGWFTAGQGHLFEVQSRGGLQREPLLAQARTLWAELNLLRQRTAEAFPEFLTFAQGVAALDIKSVEQFFTSLRIEDLGEFIERDALFSKEQRKLIHPVTTTLKTHNRKAAHALGIGKVHTELQRYFGSIIRA